MLPVFVFLLRVGIRARVIVMLVKLQIITHLSLYMLIGHVLHILIPQILKLNYWFRNLLQIPGNFNVVIACRIGGSAPGASL